MEQHVPVKGGRPRQRVSWSEKTKSKMQWFKDTANYYISISRFYGANTSTGAFKDGRNLKLLYDVYNNQFPAGWFTHFTNPLSAQSDQHRRLPAKVRPTTILRSNIDLLIGEYRNRPFTYTVQNLGDDGYNEYTEQLNQKVNANLQDHFYQQVLQQLQAQGANLEEEAPSPDEIPLPEQVEKDLLSSYKDKYAVKGQKWLDRARREYEVDRMRIKMFKDWCIAGESYSFKGFINGDFTYRRVNPMDVDYDKSPENDFIEDGEWVVERRLLVLSDVVDNFFHELKPKEYDQLEEKGPWYSPAAFYDYLYSTVNNNYVPVYHIQWKGVKEMLYITGVDDEGNPYEDMVDEDHVLAEGETIVRREWVTEVYETTRIADLFYVGMGALPVQRNPMNNFSCCKLSYNGRKYSDTNSVNLSPLEMGIPFQIMYIIVNFVLEKMLAKSKGNILLFDKNAIPRTNGWNEEKFFYYLEALNIGLLNRHQQGVDRSWNQYTTMNMSQLSEISMLTQMQQHIVQQWDDTLGINRQRKGQTLSSDGQGVNERAVFQSSVITDMIMNGFEEFMEREMQGILDFGRFINAGGTRALYNEDLTTVSLLEVDPEDFAMSSLGVFSTRSNELVETLNGLKQNTQAMLQNGVAPSTIVEIYNARNLAQLQQILKSVEKMQAENARAAAEQEQANALELEEMKKAFEEFKADLDLRYMNAEYDRRESLALVEAEAKANNEPEDSPVTGPSKQEIDREKMATQERMQERQLAFSQVQDDNNRQLKQRELDIKEKAANKKPASTK